MGIETSNRTFIKKDELAFDFEKLFIETEKETHVDILINLGTFLIKMFKGQCSYTKIYWTKNFFIV